MEQRRHKRVAFETEAVVRSGEVSIRGKVSNLSMKGMFFQTKERLPSGDLLNIEIHLTGSASDLAISVKGLAARQTEDGVGIIFKEMDLDSFTHLKNVVAYNSDDADEIEDEFYNSIGNS